MIRGILLLLIVLAILIGPQLWTKYVFKKYRGHREEYSGTGGELARHLLDRFEMQDVQVETTELGDHYDPQAKVVRLTPDNYNGKSLTAVTVAAHEVGHAIQDKTGYKPLHERTKLVRVAQGAENGWREAAVPLPAGEWQAATGMIGIAKIATRRVTIAQALTRAFRQTVRIDLWL